MSDGKSLRRRFHSCPLSVDGEGSSRERDPFLSFENGDVDHVQLLSSQLSNLLRGADNTDVIFVVENRQFEAHRIILSARCEYFRALLFGGMREATNSEKIELHDTSAKTFEYLLKYIYTGIMYLREMEERDILDMLVLANRYSLLALESAITGYLKDIITIENVPDIFDVSSVFGIIELDNSCLSYMDQHAADILPTEGFARLSKKSLEQIVSRTSFCAQEIDIFKAVKRWAKENDDDTDITELLGHVRLPLIELKDLLHDVRDSDLYCADEILNAVQVKTESSANNLPSRGYLAENENIAQTCHDAEALTGEMKESLFDIGKPAYDLEKGYVRHVISDKDKGIIIKLGRPSIINTIKLLLWDLDARCYSYKLEYSMDNEDWGTIIDYSKYSCRSTQTVKFDPIVTRYVRVLGTHNSLNKCFHLVSFECAYSSSCLPVQDGFIVPTENVASVMAKAIVTEGVSRNRNALIDGDTKNYDWESGYTCHQIGSGCITIQLAQPFMIGSMRMLLWDCDDRSYSFYIQVSLDQTEWVTVCDKKDEACKSWQTVSFNLRPISFIKIIGTRNTSNEVFHVVHFECPAVEDSSSSSSTTESVADREPEISD